jgi:imidazolonepropionase
MRPLLIRGARQLLTLRGPATPRRGAELRELGLIPDGAVLIKDGLIDCVGPTRRVENLAAARGAMEIDATGKVVMPGFVDSHTHLVSGAWRLADYEMRIAGADYQQIAQAGGGVLASLRAVRETPGRSLQRRARGWLGEMIRTGTTTIEAKSGYGLDETGELKTLRVYAALDGGPVDIVPTYLGAHAVPPEYQDRADDYTEWVATAALATVHRRKAARFVDVCCERGAFTSRQARRILEAARDLGFGLKIHAEQFSHEGGTKLAVELRAVSVDHLEYTTSEDIELLAHSATMATLLPGPVFHMGLDRYPPARELIDRGAAVALATDFNPGTSPSSNMQMMLALACAKMRMTPAEAIGAATINGAHAVERAAQVGSLEPGKQADVLIFHASDYREISYHFGVNLLVMTIKRGEVLYQQAGVKWPDQS